MWLAGVGMAYGTGRDFVEGECCRCAHRFRLDPAFFSTPAGSGNMLIIRHLYSGKDSQTP